MEKSIKKTVMTSDEQNRADEIRSNLAYCTGTENYAKYQIGRAVYLVTDGVRTMAEMCGAYWLIDLIVSHQYKTKVHDLVFPANKSAAITIFCFPQLHKHNHRRCLCLFLPTS